MRNENISDIRKMPVLVEEIPPGAKGVHESVLRAYNILEKVKHLLEEKTPSKIVLELIREMEGKKPLRPAEVFIGRVPLMDDASVDRLMERISERVKDFDIKLKPGLTIEPAEDESKPDPDVKPPEFDVVTEDKEPTG